MGRWARAVVQNPAKLVPASKVCDELWDAVLGLLGSDLVVGSEMKRPSTALRRIHCRKGSVSQITDLRSRTVIASLSSTFAMPIETPAIGLLIVSTAAVFSSEAKYHAACPIWL